MLIRFCVKNFLSFKEETEFSLIAGKTRQHSNHLYKTGHTRNDIQILRSGIIYGANASGKSNLVKAIYFAKRLITKGVEAQKSIPVTPFKLDPNSLIEPAKFEFEYMYKGKNYLYGFEIDSKRVHSEWLYEIKKTSQAPIFERRTDNQNRTAIEFPGVNLVNKEDRQLLQFVAKGTRPNQLFLRESIDRNIHYFLDAYNWFSKSLTIIFPETRFNLILDVGNEFTQSLVKYLEEFGTGVYGFSLEKISPETEALDRVMDEVIKDLKPKEKASVMEASKGRRYLISKDEQGEIAAQKLMLKHPRFDCNDEVPFDTSEESDGTIRLMDLIPVLLLKKDIELVFIIDELDRSLHPNLSYKLIDLFLNDREGKNQLIVTTHEAQLLNLNLIRRDEIWFVEKDNGGNSKMYSLEEFSPRYDKDIQKGYLFGRFGAIPLMGKKEF